MVLIKGKVDINSKLFFNNKNINLEVIVKNLNDDGSRVVNFYQDKKILDFNSVINILDQIGQIPLPNYMKEIQILVMKKIIKLFFQKIMVQLQLLLRHYILQMNFLKI